MNEKIETMYKLLKDMADESLMELDIPKEKLNNSTSELCKMFNCPLEFDLVKSFGDYLYDAMGSAVNTTKRLKVNNTFFESDQGKRILEKAKESGLSLERFLKDTTYYNKYPTYMVVHKQFGLKPTGKNRCEWFNRNVIFDTLTEEHVNLIDDEEKRLCVEDFLNFRNKAVETIKPIVIPVNIEVNSVTLNILSNNSLLIGRRGNSGYNPQNNIYINNNNEKGLITNVILVSNRTPVWDKISEWDDFYLYHDTNSFRNNVTAHCFNTNDNIIYYYGCVDLSKNTINCPIYHNFNDVNYTKIKIACGVNLGAKSAFRDGVEDLKFINKEVFKSEDITNILENKSIITNWHDIIDNPLVNSEIKKLINRLNDTFNSFNDLKQKHAKLVMFKRL